MGLTHCPICVGLAVLSVLRSGMVVLQLWGWLAPVLDVPSKDGVPAVAGLGT